jgi:hypothetical protein
MAAANPTSLADKAFLGWFSLFQGYARRATLVVSAAEIVLRHLVSAGREISALSLDAPPPPAPLPFPSSSVDQ